MPRITPFLTAGTALALVTTASAQFTNDECVDAMDIGLGSYPYDGFTATMTASADQPFCFSGISGTAKRDLWFRYTACVDENVTVTVAPVNNSTACSGFFNAQSFVAVYDGGDCATATVLDCVSGGCFFSSTTVSTFAAVAGNSYLIRVATETFNSSPTWGFGDVTLTSDRSVGTELCAGVANSTGEGALLSATGSEVAADNAVCFQVTGLPENSTGYFLNSRQSILLSGPGGSQGDLCIASLAMGRHSADVLDSGATGSVDYTVDLTALPRPMGAVTAMAGETWYWQYWYRDVTPTSTSNFSGARCITFQ